MTFDSFLSTAFSIIVGAFIVNLLCESLLEFSPLDYVKRLLNRINPD